MDQQHSGTEYNDHHHHHLSLSHYTHTLVNFRCFIIVYESRIESAYNPYIDVKCSPSYLLWFWIVVSTKMTTNHQLNSYSRTDLEQMKSTISLCVSLLFLFYL